MHFNEPFHVRTKKNYSKMRIFSQSRERLHLHVKSQLFLGRFLHASYCEFPRARGIPHCLVGHT